MSNHIEQQEDKVDEVKEVETGLLPVCINDSEKKIVFRKQV